MLKLSIERSTTAERIAAALRQQILAGELAPGTRLREVELSRSLDVSRHTLREAIARLVSDGLLTRASYKGVGVTKLTAEDIRDIYAARKTIELSAVDAIPLALPERRRGVFTAIESLYRRAAAADSEAVHLADSAIHVALVACLGSQRLSRTHAGLLAELRLVLSTSYKPAERRETAKAHREFAALVRRSEMAAARKHLEARLEAAEELIIRDLLKPRQILLNPGP